MYFLDRKKCPLHENSVSRKILVEYEKFRKFVNDLSTKNFKQTENWTKKVNLFNEAMTKMPLA